MTTEVHLRTIVADEQLLAAQRLVNASQCLLEVAVHRWGDDSRSEARIRQIAEMLIDAADALVPGGA